MSQIAILADTHFGVHGRLQDILWALRVVRECCKAAKIQTIIILGDLCHDRRHLEIDVLNAMCDFFEESSTKYGQLWITFPGNHDMFLKHSWKINSLAPLRKFLRIIDQVSILRIEDVPFYVVPFITYEKVYMRVINDLIKKGDADLLLTHIGVNGANLNTCFTLKEWSIVEFPPAFKRVYTGHFHSNQEINNVKYPGSLIPFKFDEGDIPHGFYVLDLKTLEDKFINIWKAGEKFLPGETPPPQFHTVLDEQITNLTSNDVKNNILRISLQKEHTDNEKQEIKKYLMAMGARSIRWMNLYKQESVGQAQIIVQRKPLFEQWIEQDKNGIKDLDINILRQFNEEIVHDGDEMYNADEDNLSEV